MRCDSWNGMGRDSCSIGGRPDRVLLPERRKEGDRWDLEIISDLVSSWELVLGIVGSGKKRVNYCHKSSSRVSGEVVSPRSIST